MDSDKNGNLNPEQYIVFDLETTGLDTAQDQIIEISIRVGDKKDSELKTRRVKPTIPISATATAVHGIKMSDLKDCPTFKQIGTSLREYFEQAKIIVGYNVIFDIQVLQAELQRNGFKPISFQEKYIIDPLNIWRNLRPRKLSDAYKKFCGKELVDAHSAEADVKATHEVYQAMLSHFDLKKSDPRYLMSLSVPADWLGISNQIRWRFGVPVFAFGKGKGKSVWDYLRAEKSYFDWMKNANFLPHVLEICETALSMDKDRFLDWAKEKYPYSEDLAQNNLD